MARKIAFQSPAGGVIIIETPEKAADMTPEEIAAEYFPDLELKKKSDE